MGDRMLNNGLSQKPVRKRWGLILMLPLLVGMFAFFILAMEWRGSLRIQRVVVKGFNTITAKEIANLAKVPTKTYIYTANLYDIQGRILRQSFIKSVQVNRQFPNKLSIEIVERIPVVSINCGQLCYIDADGVLFTSSATQKGFDIPLVSGISGAQTANIGKIFFSKEIFEAIEICQTAQLLDTALYHLISEINMNNGGDIILYTSDVGMPIMLGRKDIEKKLAMLENFWLNVAGTPDADKLHYIDLRFEDQVIVKQAAQQKRQEKKYSL